MSEDINQEILAELRRIRTFIRRMCYAIVVLIILASVPAFQQGWRAGSPSWEQVRSLMSRQDFPVALSMAQSLVAAQPHYDYGHVYLGYVYLAMGDITNAEKQYSDACAIFPSEENQKNLAAVQKRLAAGASFRLQSTLPPMRANKSRVR
jgi:tetratricopeptide (TPR) repeat protein